MVNAKVNLAANQLPDVPVYRSHRYAIALVSFFGFMFVYVLRVNFSVAIVCMIKPRNRTSQMLVAGNLSDVCGGMGDVSNSRRSYEGEFDWSQETKSKLLASFFYGYIVTQIPGGWLARRYGTRKVFAIGMLATALSTIAMPVCARASVYLVYVMRVIGGLGSGVVFPAAQCMWGRWVPPAERSKIPGTVYTGPTMGSLVTMAMSGVMCAYGFDNGWGSIFYISGLCTLLWLVLWWYFVYDTPGQHPRISRTERDFIAHSIGDSYHEPEKSIVTPWGAMFRSRALWAVIVAHFCNNWTNYTLMTGLPSYMNDVLNFDIKTNGLLSAIPYICTLITSIAVARLADYIRAKGWLTTQNTRRVSQTTEFVGLATLLTATGFVTCEMRMLAVAVLSLAVSFSSFAKGGYLVNHIDFAPRYAGELFGITNTVATLPGMIAPIVNGALTPNGTQGEWQVVFMLCAGFAIFGCVVFFVLVKGEVEPWAQPRGVVEEVEPMAIMQGGDGMDGVKLQIV